MSEHRRATTHRSATSEHAPSAHVSGAEHAEREHPGHGVADHHRDGGGSHHAHMVADFRRRFWVSLVLSIPVLALAPLIQGWLGLGDVLAFRGYHAVQAVLATVIYFYGGWPFLGGFVSELKKRQPGMMTLIAVATTVAWGYSALVTLGERCSSGRWRR
jgi:P-type Cu2+ transporter